MILPAQPSMQRFREHWARAVGALWRRFGDPDLAEESVQEAFTRAAARWPVEGVPAEPAAWVIATAGNVALDRLRRDRTLALKLPAARAAGRGARPRPPGRPPARRPPRADLRLLPPGARLRRSGRAHAAACRRPVDARDRACLPRLGAGHGPAAGAGEAPAARRRDRASRLAGAGDPGAPRPGDGRAVPDLQRGLLGLVRRRARPPGAVRRGDPPRPRAREPAAGRARAGRARRAHALPPCPRARADRRPTERRSCSTTRTGGCGTAS